VSTTVTTNDSVFSTGNYTLGTLSAYNMNNSVSSSVSFTNGIYYDYDSLNYSDDGTRYQTYSDLTSLPDVVSFTAFNDTALLTNYDMLLYNGTFVGPTHSAYINYANYNGWSSQPDYSGLTGDGTGYRYLTMRFYKASMASYSNFTLTFNYTAPSSSTFTTDTLTLVTSNLFLHLSQYINSRSGYVWANANSKYDSTSYSTTVADDNAVLLSVSGFGSTSGTASINIAVGSTANVNNYFYIRIGLNTSTTVSNFGISF